jgi:hypothetical protein
MFGEDIHRQGFQKSASIFQSAPFLLLLKQRSHHYLMRTPVDNLHKIINWCFIKNHIIQA